MALIKLPFYDVMDFALFFSKVMNFRPMIIPYIQLNSVHLFIKLIIRTNFKRNKCQLRRTFNNRLTFTQQWKYTVVTLISPELFCCSNNSEIFTVSNKYCALTWSNIYLTIIGVINVYVGSNIKNKIFRLFAIVDVILLTFYWIDFFHFKLISLVFKSIVVRIVLFLYGFWF